jgi:hypothetical protein
MRLGDETLTTYILAIGHEAGWSIPEEPKERMESGLRKFIEGRLFRGSPLPTRLKEEALYVRVAGKTSQNSARQASEICSPFS